MSSISRAGWFALGDEAFLSQSRANIPPPPQTATHWPDLKVHDWRARVMFARVGFGRTFAPDGEHGRLRVSGPGPVTRYVSPLKALRGERRKKL